MAGGSGVRKHLAETRADSHHRETLEMGRGHSGTASPALLKLTFKKDIKEPMLRAGQVQCCLRSQLAEDRETDCSISRAAFLKMRPEDQSGNCILCLGKTIPGLTESDSLEG